MTTKCYIIENSAECAKTVQHLELMIPCFSWMELLDDDSIEYTISCREEDVVVVEALLARFV